MFALSATRILEAAKKTTPTSITSFLPQMSLHLVQTGPVTALASWYAAPIQTYPDAECRSAHILGIATETIVWSKAGIAIASCEVISGILEVENQKG